MLTAITTIAVAVIAGLVTLSGSLLTQRRDRREREAIKEEIALLPTIPSQQARDVFAAHVKRRIMLYVHFENSRRARRSDIAMAVTLLLMSSLLIVAALLPEDVRGRVLWGDELSWRYMAPSYVLFALGLWFLFSSFGPVTPKQRAALPRPVRLPRWVPETYSLPTAEVPAEQPRRRFNLFRRQRR